MAFTRDRADASDRAARQATEWFVLLGRPQVTAEEHAAYQAWLTSDPAHAQAMEDVRLLWGRLDEPLAHLAETTPLVPPAAYGHGRAWKALAIAAAAAVVMVGAALWRDSGLLDRAFADYATAPGERRDVQLEDGSHLYLDGDTAITAGFTARERAVIILRGRAWFDVESDAARPFQVKAGLLETRVLGTAFGIDRNEGTVTVEHGRVAVSAGPGQQTRLSDGERVALECARLGVPIRIEPETVLGWRRGLIILDSAPLGDVVDELGHMAPGRVIIPDAGLRSLTLSGVFHADDPEAVLEAMRRGLGLRTFSIPGFATLVYR